MKKIILLLLFVFFAASIYAQTSGERVYIEAVEFTDSELKTKKLMLFDENMIQPKKGDDKSLSLLIPATIDFAVNQVSTALKKRAKKFIGKYNPKYVGDNFYAIDAIGKKLKIKQFVIVRETNNTRNAEIVLKPVMSADEAFFRLEVSKVKIDKGRTNKIKNKIDIELNIAFVSKNKTGDSYPSEQSTKDLKILIEGLHLGTAFTDLKNASTQWIKVPSPSKLNDKMANGVFELLVDVTETDSFKDRSEAISTKYDANKDKLSEILKELLNNKDK